jgi:uncharacterized protein (TIGR03083 family)
MDGDPFEHLEAEAHRVDRFYANLGPPEWHVPTRCAGWDRKDLLAHLVGIEDYTRACLDDRVAEYAEQAADVGYERLNDVLVERRRDDAPEDLLVEWRAKVRDNLARLRERGPDGQIATSVGPYPLGRQAWYLACELAIHADDADVPVEPGERDARQAWRAAFGLDALAEVHPSVSVTGYRVRVEDAEASLTEADFVEATSGRLADSSGIPSPVLRALRVFA